MRHAALVLLVVLLLAAVVFPTAGCGLFDNNPRTLFTYEPCIFGCPDKSGVPSAPTVGLLDLRRDVDGALAALLGRPVDALVAHVPEGGVLETFRATAQAWGLDYEVAAAGAAYVGPGRDGEPLAIRDVVLLRVGSRASGEGRTVVPSSGLLEAGEVGRLGEPLPRGWVRAEIAVGHERWQVIGARLDGATEVLRGLWLAELELLAEGAGGVALWAVADIRGD